ncbi:MAG: UDP-N-acetylmuramoyl-tripeptide--D-alanyl-D-alanine ligase [Eubacterium sp.]|nr:UDP-N-acetylmuramoyl-tripeptide--D-alanyl-D-alanine ligase [Eubacterium sp.]
MKPVSISKVCEAVRGSLLWGDPEALVSGVHTDSREIGEGDLFIPIIGARVDAHEYIPDVIEAGAACVISSEDVEESDRGACIRVTDTVEALQALAAWYRAQFDIPLIGITGSVGKTSTKEMVGAVLSKKYNTLITHGNMNSQVGLPLMMFHIEPEHEMAVIEMGISMPDEMDRLVDIASPCMAVMTNIGVSHIGNLGSRENICREKGRIIREFGEDGRLFACGDGDLYDLIRKNVPFDICKGECPVSFYGISQEFTGENGGLSYYADDIRALDEGESFTFHYPGGETSASLAVMGEHNIENAVAALAVGTVFGVDIGDAVDAIRQYRPLDMRGVIIKKNGINYIDDTYNASPDSIRSNLRALFSHPGDGRRIAVLGDVLELGDRSRDLHKSIGAFIESEAANGRRLSALYTVGNESEAITDYVSENTDIPTCRCRDNYELINRLRSELQQDDWVLFKGSRGMHLDEVVGNLTKD